jgi:hypothetical protein
MISYLSLADERLIQLNATEYTQRNSSNNDKIKSAKTNNNMKKCTK